MRRSSKRVRGRPQASRGVGLFARAVRPGAVAFLIGVVAGLGAAISLTNSAAADAEEERLVLTGSSTVAPLALEIAKRFEARNPGVRVDVQSGGSTRGIQDARKGLADLGMASRKLSARTESDLDAFSIAMDGIGMIVHADNSIGSLSDEAIRQIYLGQLRNWKELGGPDRRITVVHKAAGRSTLELFVDYFALDPRAVRAHAVIGDNQQGIKTVAGNPGAIGYVSIGTAEFEAARGTPIRLVSIGGIDATVENVRRGVFPLSRPLNLVRKGELTGVAKRFVEFAQSGAVDDLVSAQYFVPFAR